MTNFDFLENIPQFHSFAKAAISAEKILHIDMEASVLHGLPVLGIGSVVGNETGLPVVQMSLQEPPPPDHPLNVLHHVGPAPAHGF